MEENLEREQHDGISPWRTLAIGILLGILLWSLILYGIGELVL